MYLAGSSIVGYIPPDRQKRKLWAFVTTWTAVGTLLFWSLTFTLMVTKFSTPDGYQVNSKFLWALLESYALLWALAFAGMWVLRSFCIPKASSVHFFVVSGCVTVCLVTALHTSYAVREAAHLAPHMDELLVKLPETVQFPCVGMVGHRYRVGGECENPVVKSVKWMSGFDETRRISADRCVSVRIKSGNQIEFRFREKGQNCELATLPKQWLGRIIVTCTVHGVAQDVERMMGMNFVRLACPNSVLERKYSGARRLVASSSRRNYYFWYEVAEEDRKWWPRHADDWWVIAFAVVVGFGGVVCLIREWILAYLIISEEIVPHKNGWVWRKEAENQE